MTVRNDILFQIVGLSKFINAKNSKMENIWSRNPFVLHPELDQNIHHITTILAQLHGPAAGTAFVRHGRDASAVAEGCWSFLGPWGCWLSGNGGWAQWWVGGKWKFVSKIPCSLESLVVGPCCWQNSGYPGCRASLPQMENPQGFSFRGSLGRLEAQQLSVPWQTSTNNRVGCCGHVARFKGNPCAWLWGKATGFRTVSNPELQIWPMAHTNLYPSKSRQYWNHHFRMVNIPHQYPQMDNPHIFPWPILYPALLSSWWVCKDSKMPAFMAHVLLMTCDILTCYLYINTKTLYNIYISYILKCWPSSKVSIFFIKPHYSLSIQSQPVVPRHRPGRKQPRSSCVRRFCRKAMNLLCEARALAAGVAGDFTTWKIISMVILLN